VNLWWSGLIGVRMPATVPLRYRGPREVNPLRGSAKDQGVGLPCPDRDSHLRGWPARRPRDAVAQRSAMVGVSDGR
jgi:hypothetical protein